MFKCLFEFLSFLIILPYCNSNGMSIVIRPLGKKTIEIPLCNKAPKVEKKELDIQKVNLTLILQKLKYKLIQFIKILQIMLSSPN